MPGAAGRGPERPSSALLHRRPHVRVMHRTGAHLSHVALPSGRLAGVRPVSEPRARRRGQTPLRLTRQPGPRPWREVSPREIPCRRAVRFFPCFRGRKICSEPFSFNFSGWIG